MYQKKLGDELCCGLEYALKMFNGKWDMKVFCVVFKNEPVRYSDYHKKLENISDPVLASTLKKLLKNGIIQRTVYDEIPPRVEYSLTEKGLDAALIFEKLCKWSVHYHFTDQPSPQLTPCSNCEDYLPSACETCKKSV